MQRGNKDVVELTILITHQGSSQLELEEIVAIKPPFPLCCTKNLNTKGLCAKC